MPKWLVPIAALCLFWPVASRGNEVGPGLYRAAEGPELASQLLIEADGHFRYMLAYGALDEQAQGHWQHSPQGVVLFTDPKPRPPRFVPDETSGDGPGPFTLRVNWPNGQGIAGIDFRLGLSDDTVVESYTQQDGWTLAPDAKAHPVWVEFYEPVHGIVSPRFAVDGAAVNALSVTLEPNDLGVVNFEGTLFAAEAGRYVLHREGGGTIRYVAAKQDEP